MKRRREQIRAQPIQGRLSTFDVLRPSLKFKSWLQQACTMATRAQRTPTACAALCTLIILAGQLASAAESEECRAMGFTGLQLCSDCDTLASYVKDEGALPLHLQI